MLGTVVVGAGVSGLATAHFLRSRLGPDYPVTVLESAEAPGGKVRTLDVAGFAVDTGPDAFLARAADLRGLVEDLGLAGEIVEPVSSGAYVWSRGKLRPLPPGAAFGLPDRLWPLLRSGLLTPTGVARAGLDLVLPATRTGADPSVRDLVLPRFGTDVYQRLVEPLLGGVHAGDPAVLSARSAVPEVAALAGKGRSLYRTMRQRRPQPPPPGTKRPAPLVSLDGGMRRLTDALADSLGDGVLRTATSVEAIAPGTAGRLAVTTSRGAFDADHVVLAAPAWAAADMLGQSSPKAAEALREIPYTGVANATLVFARDRVPELPPGTGFLVPPAEGEFIVGCSWLSSKWPHLAQGDAVVIKSMVGRYGDERWQGMTDADLVAAIRADLGRMLGITAEPTAVLVQRWPRAMPQYTVGHADRLARIDAALAEVGPIHLAGAAYRGVGLAGCVTQASAAAQLIAEGAQG